ncbi:MAG: IS5 family transposase [Candidatus Neomarinimicrobiota bacterium]
MKPKKQYEESRLFQSRLDQIIDLKHPLCVLAKQIDWEYFDQKFGGQYVDQIGRPGIPTRIMVSLHYLKHTYNESDESVVIRFLENPYWQCFGGLTYFTHRLPINPSSMTRWRNRIGEDGIAELLTVILNAAITTGELQEKSLNQVNIDTTVQEKAISYPTDAKLYYRMLTKLVKAANEREISLRQSYVRLSKQALLKQGRYAHARQMKRSRREIRKLKIYLGRVYRDILRKAPVHDCGLENLLSIAGRLLNQNRTDKNKLYSIHAPEVECISKGKAHKRYEFGVKVGIATTSRDNWIIGVRTFAGNPYDGHTLQNTVDSIQRHLNWHPQNVNVDLGYRGHDYVGEARIHVVDFRQMKKLTATVKKWFKRRAAIEPVFGHLKSDNRMSRNYLKGVEGDRINPILCACGYNMRKLLKVFFLSDFLNGFIRLFLIKNRWLSTKQGDYFSPAIT